VAVELVLGIVLGPAVLGVIHVSSFIGGLAAIALALLMFLVGFELDLHGVRGGPLGWLPWAGRRRWRSDSPRRLPCSQQG